jgi:hypothetical protein
VLSSVFASYGGYRSRQQFVDGMVAAQWVGAVALAVAALLARGIPAMRIQAEAASEALTSDGTPEIVPVSALG